MEPTIYKPSAYKSPGIYKGAGGIYKGRGVYKDGILEGFEYLTYFNRFDLENKTDYPVKGNITLYGPCTGKPMAELRKDTVNTWKTALTFVSYNSYNYTCAEPQAGLLGDVSIEFFEMGYISPTANFGIISSKDLLITDDFIVIGTDNNIPYVYTNKYYSYTLKNGASYVSTGDRYRFRLPVNTLNGFHHIAIVLNRSDYKIKLYVDGIIYLELISNDELFQNLLFNATSYSDITITQLCIRKGDLSYNNGNNYPVPIKPYY